MPNSYSKHSPTRPVGSCWIGSSSATDRLRPSSPRGGSNSLDSGVMKHLGVLIDAGLITTRKQGRYTLHFLNPVPIQQIHDRWIGKYTARSASALVELKQQLEDES